MHFLTFMRPMVLRPYSTPTGHRPRCFLKGLSNYHLHSKSRLLLCCSSLVITNTCHPWCRSSAPTPSNSPSPLSLTQTGASRKRFLLSTGHPYPFPSPSLRPPSRSVSNGHDGLNSAPLSPRWDSFLHLRIVIKSFCERNLKVLNISLRLYHDMDERQFLDGLAGCPLIVMLNGH